jgi:DNA repair exonuclease SbcCD ATPase subunit
MLNRIEVRDFQSLARADIALGRFTVITGPTGSGKSALFRAALALARNTRGTANVRRGQKSCSVAAGGHGWIVRLTPSVSPRGKNEYRLARLAPTQVEGVSGWAAVTYTKLNSQVPPPVEDLLRLSELNFARQLDPPYLLGLPGSEIARRLGDLTNVSLVLGAAGDAGRIRKQAQRDLDAACARRDALMEEAQEFAGIRERRAACTAAEEALATAQATSASVERLRALTGRLEAAEGAVAAARAETACQAPPSLERLDELLAAVGRLRELAGDLEAAERDAARFRSQAAQARRDEVAAETAVRKALADAGQCPVCRQAVA